MRARREAFQSGLAVVVLGYSILAVAEPGRMSGQSGDQLRSNPFLAFLPAESARTGAAVIVVPGVRDGRLALDADGTDVAAWLTARGIAAFVLQYRGGARGQDDEAVADVLRAVQTVRARAAEYKISESRIGVLGFGSGAGVAGEAAYGRAAEGIASSPDVVARASSRVDFLGLIFGAPSRGPTTAVGAPPTFLVASSAEADGQTASFALWTTLRAARVPVDAHLFAKADASLGLGKSDAAVGAWPELFYSWVRYRGWLTGEPRAPLTGMAYLDDRPLPHGYVVFTPADKIGAGPVVARVLNSTAGVPIGQFTVPASQGPVPGRYRVEMHQNASRWLSNAFTPMLTADPAFGHARILSPSLDDHRVYRRVHPSDSSDYVVEIERGGRPNLEIRMFTAAAPPPPVASPLRADIGVTNPGIAAYLEQLKYTPNPVPGVAEPLLLWPGGAPNAVPDARGVFTDEDAPAIYPYPAPAATNTGTAMLVIPGGAFTNRAIDQEGIQVARWLNRQGIGAFVLRYRIRPNYNGQISIADAHRAMRVVRAHAPEYGLDPNRVGTIGFSAGAELAGDAFFNRVLPGDPGAVEPLDRISTRPNFNVLIYGGRNLTAPATVPPTFMFVTLEDGGNHLAPQIDVMTGLRRNGIPVEAHWYQDGPHGTSMSPGDPQLGQWPDLLINWLRAQGLLKNR
jgi:acetyl esterase/lipase